MVSIPHSSIQVDEQFTNIIVPVWDEFVLATGRDANGQPRFFEVKTHNSPGGQAATDLTANEIFQEIKLKINVDPKESEGDEAKKAPLVYLGKIQVTQSEIHVWMLKLPDEMVITEPALVVRLNRQSDPSSKFCTEIVSAGFIRRTEIPLTSSGPMYMLRVHTDLEGKLSRLTLYP